MGNTTYARPRARLIYPETLDSAQIRELAKNPLHLLVWYGLYHGVDDQGRMECRVSTIQASCLRHLPESVMKPSVVKEALDRMRSIKDDDGVPLVYVYPASADPNNDTRVIQLAKWWEYQGGMKNAWPSRWPKPPAEIAPTWQDQIIGYGKKVYQKLIDSGEIQGEGWGQIGANVSPPVGENIPVNLQSRSKKEPKGSSEQPFTLLAAYLEERGLPLARFPGMNVQLRHAKLMLTEGFTPDNVREGTRLLAQDEFWSRRGFDLATIRSQWTRLKSAQQAAKPKARAPRPLTE